jgi:hypothetical protein
MDKAHETARAVTALFDLAAIGVENPVTEIDPRLLRGLDQQDLVATDAEMAISQVTQLFRCQRKRLANAVEDDEIVAQTVHLREFKFHSRPHLTI